jgi:hypothetical protein
MPLVPNTITRVGSASSGLTTATVPAHAVGDLILVYAFRDGNATPPSLPTGFTNIVNGGANSCSIRVGYKFATSTSDTSGTWTSASELVVVVYRNVASVGHSATNQASSTTVNYPAVTITGADAWFVAGAGTRNTDTVIETAPTGMTLVIDQFNTTADLAAHDTNAMVHSSWPSTNVSIGGTSGGWESAVVELIPTYSGSATLSVSGAQTCSALTQSANARVTDKASSATTVTALTQSASASHPSSSTVSTLFNHATDTGGPAQTDSAVTVGVVFKTSVNGNISKVSFWKTAADTSTTHTVGLWQTVVVDIQTNSTLLASVTTSGEATGTGRWVDVTLTSPIAVTANTPYVAGVFFPTAHYPETDGYFATDHTSSDGLITAPSQIDPAASASKNGRFSYGASLTYPINSFGSANYWVDVELDSGSSSSHSVSANQTVTALTTSGTVRARLTATTTETVSALTTSGAVHTRIAASAAKTVTALTQSATAKAIDSVHSSTTIAPVFAAAADVGIRASSAGTISALTQSASARVATHATSAGTLAVLTQSATATVNDISLSASGGTTVAALTQTASARVLEKASLSSTATASSVAVAAVLDQATLDAAVDVASMSGAVAVIVDGNAGSTLSFANNSLSSTPTGDIGTPTAAHQTVDALTQTAAAIVNVKVTGAESVSASQAANGTVSVKVNGATAATATQSASAHVGLKASATGTIAALTQAGNVGVRGTGAGATTVDELTQTAAVLALIEVTSGATLIAASAASATVEIVAASTSAVDPLTTSGRTTFPSSYNANVVADPLTQAASAEVTVEANAAQVATAVSASTITEIVIGSAHGTVVVITQSATADAVVHGSFGSTIDVLSQSAASDAIVKGLFNGTVAPLTQSTTTNSTSGIGAIQTVAPLTQAGNAKVHVAANAVQSAIALAAGTMTGSLTISASAEQLVDLLFITGRVRGRRANGTAAMLGL